MSKTAKERDFYTSTVKPFQLANLVYHAGTVRIGLLPSNRVKRPHKNMKGTVELTSIFINSYLLARSFLLHYLFKDRDGRPTLQSTEAQHEKKPEVM